jgi:hypothetical protein
VLFFMAYHMCDCPFAGRSNLLIRRNVEERVLDYRISLCIWLCQGARGEVRPPEGGGD